MMSKICHNHDVLALHLYHLHEIIDKYGQTYHLQQLLCRRLAQTTSTPYFTSAPAALARRIARFVSSLKLTTNAWGAHAICLTAVAGFGPEPRLECRNEGLRLCASLGPQALGSHGIGLPGLTRPWAHLALEAAGRRPTHNVISEVQ